MAVLSSMIAPNTSPVIPPSRRRAVQAEQGRHGQARHRRRRAPGRGRHPAQGQPGRDHRAQQHRHAGRPARGAGPPGHQGAEPGRPGRWRAGGQPPPPPGWSPRPAPARTPPSLQPCGSEASALTWTSSTSTRVATPSGPASDRRMISRAWSAGRRLPSPSAVSASPSRCRPPVATASSATARAAPRNCRSADNHPPQRKPSRPTRPIPGRRRGPAARTRPGPPLPHPGHRRPRPGSP